MNLLSFDQLKKNLKKPTDGYKRIRVAVLCDMASQFIVMALKGYAISRGINLSVFEADHNQIDRQVFDPSSDLYIFEPEYAIILQATEHFGTKFYKSDNAEKENFAADQIAHLDALCGTLSDKLPKCRIITNTHIELNDSVFGNFATKVPTSLLYQSRLFNLKLMELAQTRKDLSLVDVAALATEIGYRQSFDAKMFYRADVVFSFDMLPYVAKNITDVMLSTAGSFKKCIILDLDNTLWGGIIGDDGIDGIRIGGLGDGKTFAALQLWIKQLKQRGMIVAVCSKNTEEIALEPFEKHPEMVLRTDDIAVFVANWDNKADNIRHIQDILNIGMDSIVFIDDNPFEREMVKREIPDITVPDMPEDPAEYLLFLKSLNLFETASYTQGDQQRTQQYQEEAKRNKHYKSFANEDEFLASLDMVAEVMPFNSYNIPRVAQLSQRSNQFNLRTVRYTEEDLGLIAENPDYHTYSFSLADKYGDNGLIAFVVVKQTTANTLFIENWAMSCRVLKRGMEAFTLKYIAEDALKKGFEKLTGEYIPTKKNQIVQQHYSVLGFVQTADNVWELDLLTFTPLPNHIQYR